MAPKDAGKGKGRKPPAKRTPAKRSRARRPALKVVKDPPAEVEEQTPAAPAQVGEPSAWDPPTDLDGEAVARWHRVIRALTVEAAWKPDLDLATVERMCRAEMEARQFRAHIQADGGYMVLGSQGQKVRHPLIKDAESRDRAAQAYAASLLMTPQARGRDQGGGDGDASRDSFGALVDDFNKAASDRERDMEGAAIAARPEAEEDD